MAAWAVILPCLTLFSVLLIADALAGSQSLAEAVETVSEGQSSGTVVVYESDSAGEGGLQDWVDGDPKRVCWVSTSDAARISSAYRTSWTTEGDIQVLVVYDASEGQLRQILGDRQKRCTFIREKRTFFLPLDPHMS